MGEPSESLDRVRARGDREQRGRGRGKRVRGRVTGAADGAAKTAGGERLPSSSGEQRTTTQPPSHISGLGQLNPWIRCHPTHPPTHSIQTHTPNIPTIYILDPPILVLIWNLMS